MSCSNVRTSGDFSSSRLSSVLAKDIELIFTLAVGLANDQWPTNHPLPIFALKKTPERTRTFRRLKGGL